MLAANAWGFVGGSGVGGINDSVICEIIKPMMRVLITLFDIMAIDRVITR